MTWRRAVLRTRRGEEGITIIEFALGMTLLGGIVLVCFSTLSIFLGAAQNDVNTGQATQRASEVLSELRTEIVSANIIFDPSQEGSNAGTGIPSGFSMRVYTQLNGIWDCVQWRVTSIGQFQIRQWQPNGQVQSWSTLAGGVVNPASSPPFALDSGSNYGGTSSSRLVDVDLMFSTATGAVPATFTASIAARDAEYFPPNTGDCSPVPAP